MMSAQLARGSSKKKSKTKSQPPAKCVCGDQRCAQLRQNFGERGDELGRDRIQLVKFAKSKGEEEKPKADNNSSRSSTNDKKEKKDGDQEVGSNISCRNKTEKRKNIYEKSFGKSLPSKCHVAYLHFPVELLEYCRSLREQGIRNVVPSLPVLGSQMVSAGLAEDFECEEYKSVKIAKKEAIYYIPPCVTVREAKYGLAAETAAIKRVNAKALDSLLELDPAWVGSGEPDMSDSGSRPLAPSSLSFPSQPSVSIGVLEDPTQYRDGSFQPEMKVSSNYFLSSETGKATRARYDCNTGLPETSSALPEKVFSIKTMDEVNEGKFHDTLDIWKERDDPSIDIRRSYAEEAKKELQRHQEFLAAHSKPIPLPNDARIALTCNSSFCPGTIQKYKEWKHTIQSSRKEADEKLVVSLANEIGNSYVASFDSIQTRDTILDRGTRCLGPTKQHPELRFSMDAKNRTSKLPPADSCDQKMPTSVDKSNRKKPYSSQRGLGIASSPSGNFPLRGSNTVATGNIQQDATQKGIKSSSSFSDIAILSRTEGSDNAKIDSWAATCLDDTEPLSLDDTTGDVMVGSGLSDLESFLEQTDFGSLLASDPDTGYHDVANAMRKGGTKEDHEDDTNQPASAFSAASNQTVFHTVTASKGCGIPSSLARSGSMDMATAGRLAGSEETLIYCSGLPASIDAAPSPWPVSKKLSMEQTSTKDMKNPSTIAAEEERGRGASPDGNKEEDDGKEDKILVVAPPPPSCSDKRPHRDDDDDDDPSGGCCGPPSKRGRVGGSPGSCSCVGRDKRSWQRKPHCQSGVGASTHSRVSSRAVPTFRDEGTLRPLQEDTCLGRGGMANNHGGNPLSLAAAAAAAAITSSFLPVALCAQPTQIKDKEKIPSDPLPQDKESLPELSAHHIVLGRYSGKKTKPLNDYGVTKAYRNFRRTIPRKRTYDDGAAEHLRGKITQHIRDKLELPDLQLIQFVVDIHRVETLNDIQKNDIWKAKPQMFYSRSEGIIFVEDKTHYFFKQELKEKRHQPPTKDGKYAPATTLEEGLSPVCDHQCDHQPATEAKHE